MVFLTPAVKNAGQESCHGGPHSTLRGQASQGRRDKKLITPKLGHLVSTRAGKTVWMPSSLGISGPKSKNKEHENVCCCGPISAPRLVRIFSRYKPPHLRESESWSIKKSTGGNRKANQIAQSTAATRRESVIGPPPYNRHPTAARGRPMGCFGSQNEKAIFDLWGPSFHRNGKPDASVPRLTKEAGPPNLSIPVAQPPTFARASLGGLGRPWRHGKPPIGSRQPTPIRQFFLQAPAARECLPEANEGNPRPRVRWKRPRVTRGAWDASPQRPNYDIYSAPRRPVRGTRKSPPLPIPLHLRGLSILALRLPPAVSWMA